MRITPFLPLAASLLSASASGFTQPLPSGTVLRLSEPQWQCLRRLLDIRPRSAPDPRVFNVDRCPRLPSERGPQPPAEPSVVVTLTGAQQQCLAIRLARSIPAGPLDLAAVCRRAAR